MSSSPLALPVVRPTFILWRHVTRELLPPTLLGFLVFTFLMLMRFLLRISQLWIQYHAELGSVLWAIVYSLPHIIVLTLPMGVLLGGLIAFGRMSSDFEVVALRALGISLVQLVPPVLAFAGAMWLVNSWLFMVAMPWGNRSLRELQWETMTQRAVSQEVKPRVFHEDFPNLVLYIEDIVDRGAEWRGVFAAQTSHDPPAIIRAEKAYPYVDEEQRATYLLLENGTIVVPSTDPQNVVISTFDRESRLLWSEARDGLFGSVSGDPRSMTLEELHEAIATRQAEGDPAYDLRVEVHKKYAFPFACVVLGLISLPLGISTQRQTTAMGFGIGTAVIVVYYFFAQVGEQQAESGHIAPWLGMWAGNAVLGIAAALLMWKKSREAELGIARALRPHWDRLKQTAAALFREHVLHRRARSRSDATASRSGFPRLLDRYVLQMYGAIYALAFTALVVVFAAGTWIDKATYVDRPDLIPEYMAFYIWQIIADVIPVAGVVTVLSTFSLMTKRSEVTAALAGGVSLYRLVAPVLLPAVLLSGVHYALQDQVVPLATRRANEVEERMRPSDTPQLQRRQTWVYSEGRRVFHFADMIADPPEFHGLQVYYLTDAAGGIARMEYSNRAVWNADLERWEGHDGWRRYFVSESGNTDTLEPTKLEEFRLSVLPIPERPNYFAQTPRQPDEMSTLDLSRHIELLRERGYDTHRALVDFHLKLSFPAVTLVMTLVGIPFAFRMGRQGALTGIGVGIGLVIVYWIAFGVFRALGYAGTLPPLLAAWAPHLLFFALAGYQSLGLRT